MKLIFSEFCGAAESVSWTFLPLVSDKKFNLQKVSIHVLIKALNKWIYGLLFYYRKEATIESHDVEAKNNWKWRIIYASTIQFYNNTIRPENTTIDHWFKENNTITI